MFYYGDIRDLAIKRGYIAADLFSVVLGSLVYLWPLFWPHR
jgi:hypothetical protein